MKKHERFHREVLASVNDFGAAFAKWAVWLSPYDAPENISAAITKFKTQIESMFCFKEYELAKISLLDLTGKIEPVLWGIPEVSAWNERKNGRTGSGIVSAHSDKPNPDDDFIDIGALARCITVDFVERADAESWLDHTAHRNKPDLGDIPTVTIDELEGMLDENKKH